MTNNPKPSDDILRGRIIAMRSMIAQFNNEIIQLESALRNRESSPAIPEGFTPYDPNVLPPENADLADIIWKNGDTDTNVSICPLHRWGCLSSVRAYRVTKWKEEKPSLEEFIEYLAVSLDNPKQDVLEVVNRFADAIVQRAVDKVRDAQ